MFKIALIGLNQLNFTGDKQANYNKAATLLSDQAKKLGFSLWQYGKLVITPEETAVAASEAKAAGADMIMVHFASFAAGESILPIAEQQLPIGLWATEEPTADGVLPLNGLCGVNMYAGILKSYLKDAAPKYKWFYGSGQQFITRLAITVRALNAIKRMRTSRIGLIGGIAPGFNDLYFDERQIRSHLGAYIGHNEYSEMFNLASSYKAEQLTEELKTVTSGYASISDKVKQNIEWNARLYKAYKELAERNRYDALAVSCWPKLQESLDMIACSTIGKLNTAGIPAACEGDLPGAVSMLFLKYAADDITMLMDMVAYDKVDETVQLWHCGPASEKFAGKCGACMDCFYEMQNGELNRRSGMHNIEFAAGPATIMRFTGEFDRMFIAGGDFIEGKPGYFGSRGWMANLTLAAEPTSAEDMVETIFTSGFAHHYPIVMGAYSAVMMEASAWLGMDVTNKIAYKDYLQTFRG